MKKILFVDDEPMVLRGLKRSFLDFPVEIFSAATASDAIQIMKNSEIDLIVSDLKMPTVDGVALLKIVAEKFPETIRFAMTGYNEAKKILKVIGLSHKIFSKPINENLLKESIKYAFEFKERINNPKILKLVSGTKTIPSPSQTYIEIVKELQKEDFSLKNVTEIISKDVGLFSNILKIVNSSYFGIPKRIETAQEAITFLGMDAIKSIVIFSEISINNKEANILKNLPIDDINKHSTIVANFAKKIAQYFELETELKNKVFMAGMLHDIGYLIYARISEIRPETKSVLAKICAMTPEEEYKTLSFSHAEIGAFLLNLWNFDYEIVEAVAFHHNFSQKEKNIGFILYLAENIVSSQNSKTNFADEDFIKNMGLENDIKNLINLYNEMINSEENNE